ncbi:GAF domain-containing protein [Lutibacter sp.]
MRVIPSNYKNRAELPLKLKISFEAVFEYLKKITEDKNHYLYHTASNLLNEYQQYPVLKEGFEDFSLLIKYRKEINKLLNILFPEPLQSNEIKAASIPFEFTAFKFSKRFQQILDDAGDDYEFKLRNFDEANIYILACTFILAYHYKIKIDFRRPFFFDIPNKKTGLIKHYRTLYNGDFFKITPLEGTKPITDEDVKVLIDNFNNIDVWKEKFPPNSYEFKGFGIMNLFDVTPDESISKLKENLLKKNHQSFDFLESSISALFGTTNIKFGFSSYNLNHKRANIKYHKEQKSFIIPEKKALTLDNFFCESIKSTVFENGELLAISDLEKYGKENNYNKLYKTLKKQGIQSIILVPLKLSNEMFGIMEFVSKNKYQLNSVNAYKLKDIIPVFKIALQRYTEEFQNKLESIIQKNYTSIHPTVEWRFYEEAEKYYYESEFNNTHTPKLEDIIFENVIPLYGQCDIKGSSVARNNAIRDDLMKQLNLASEIILKAKKRYKLPIYNDLIFRIDKCLSNISSGLKSSDETSLIDFLQKDIYPVFSHLKSLDAELNNDIENYLQLIDDKLHVIYDKRKKYEESVNTLNEELAKFIDTKQIEAQTMFPHYFERYKTDGIDYNIYIGQSLVKNYSYNNIYLQNLRLWQLQMMCEMENIAYHLKNKLTHPLEVASLILVHSTPLSIKFRMDEKRFDVDGAYNIRYEIIKKRIDKALLKNSKERLTQPGKITIVYSQDKDAEEYLKYIKYLQSNNYLLDTVEKVKLEDLQGISGLKALRVDINYSSKAEEKITFDDLMKFMELDI